MTEQEYRHLTELIENQNNMEVELYPIAVDVIKESTKGLSKRYVFSRRKSKRSQIYYGLSSFPDVAILDTNYENKEIGEDGLTLEEWNVLKGCIEVKELNSKLYSIKDIQDVFSNGKFQEIEGMSQNKYSEIVRLIGEVLWYKKLLYTNGKEWRLLSTKIKTDDIKLKKEIKDKLEKKIIEVVNNRIDADFNKKDFNWWKSFKNFGFDFEISDDYITKDCLNDWNNFIIGINDIKWLEE